MLGDGDRRCQIKLSEDGNIIDKEDEVANVINDFFVNKIEKLKSNINPSWKTDPLKKIAKLKSRFTFQKISVEHVSKIIAKMKSSNSSGVDGISSRVLKLVQEEVAPALSVLINSSLLMGVVPKIIFSARAGC